MKLVVYGITAEQWQKRYGVEPFSHPCSECGTMLTTSLPFVEDTIHGLEAPTCECGNVYTPFCFVPGDAK